MRLLIAPPLQHRRLAPTVRSRLRCATTTTSTGHDGLAPAERLLSRAADGATARGRPLSRRARQTQRSVEAYLKAGVRPRWMERVDEIDQGIAAEKQRLARAYRALQGGVRRGPGRLRGALARARAARGGSTTSTCSSSSTTTGIRSSASSRWTRAPATTCASRGARTAVRCSARTGSSSTSRPSSTFPAPVRAGRPRSQGKDMVATSTRHTAGPDGSRRSPGCRRPARRDPAGVDRRRASRRVALPSLGAGSAPLEDLAAGRQRARTRSSAPRDFGFPLSTDTAVVPRDPRGCPGDAGARRSRRARRPRPPRPGLRRPARGRPDQRRDGPPPPGERGTTAVTYLFFDARREPRRRARRGERYARDARRRARRRRRASPARARARGPVRGDRRSLPLIEGASIVAILLIVGIAFRSIGAPLVTLRRRDRLPDDPAGSLAGRARERPGPEVEPVLIVLLLGLVTDYSVFYLSAMRRRLRGGDERCRRRAPL